IKISNTLMASKLSLAHPVDKALDSGEVLAHVGGHEATEAIVLAALLAAGVGQFVAVPATEVASARWQIQFAHPTAARFAVEHQWADEPPANPPEPWPGRHQSNAVIG